MFNILQIFLTTVMIIFSFGWNFQSLNSSFAVSSNEIGKYLSVPIKDIPHLNILLRAEYLQEDAENLYTRWFLQHTSCPHRIATYAESDFKDEFQTKLNNSRDSFVIVTNMLKFHLITERYAQKAGTFFYIIADVVVDYQKLFIVLQELWIRKSVFKNFALTADGVYIYDPFEYDTSRQSYGKIVYYSGKRNLERMLFSDMRGYPLRIQFFKSVYARPVVDKKTGKLKRVGGVDGQVAKMLQARMNFTMNFQDPDPDYFGERLPNGSYNGAIGSIIKDQIDICLTGFFVKDYMVPEMVFTVAMYDDQLCIYVPKAKRIPQSILPIFSVGYDLWLGFILTAFVCGTIWWLVRYINLRLTKNKMPDELAHVSFRWQMVRIYIDTWVVWVRVSILRYPPFDSERIFLVSLCLVSVIFGAIFESSLATVFIHPLYYKDINSMKELDDSGLKVIYKYSAMADDLFFSETSPVFASLNKKLTYVSDLNADVTLEIALYGGKASVTRQISFVLDTLPFVLAKQIWMVPECPKYYTISYILPKDSPIEEAVNRLLLRTLNAGLMKKWINELHSKVVLKIMKDHHFETNEIFKVLKITDLQLAFYVVVFGSFLSSISLLAEIYAKRSERKNKIHVNDVKFHRGSVNTGVLFT